MVKLQDLFTRDELSFLVKASDGRGFLAVATTWGMIALSFLAVGLYPSLLTVLGALIIMGGRHLALAILMHDASHYSLFKTRSLNKWIGTWICGYPTWQDFSRYQKHHLRHHQYAGTAQDPDISLIENFPITRGSLGRKFLRDLSGVTGIKRLLGLLMIDLGFYEYTVASKLHPVSPDGQTWKSRALLGIKNMSGVFVTNTILFLILAGFGHPELYLLWIGSYLTTFSLFLRIRSIAEHACTEQNIDPLRSTRTTYASPLARVTVAPHRVNYHLEHHLLMSVPYFKLPLFHRWLQQKSALKNGFVAANYLEVLKTATKGS